MAQSLNAFVGEVGNPITEARIDNAMSLSALAKRLGLSKQYVSRAEQGTYVSLNPKLIRWGAEASGRSKRQFVDAYVEYQRAKRKATVETTSPVKLIRRGEGSPGHLLFSAWRELYWPSVFSFCNALCVHPETVKLYEEGIRPKMAEPLFKVLREVDLIDENWSDSLWAGAVHGRLSA